MRALRCPSCGGANLHHEFVRVYSRPEDCEWVRTTYVDAINAICGIEASEGSANPSRRRDGLIISFSCEHCEDEPALTLSQHKGSTYLEWLDGTPLMWEEF